jgi:hypothetical protein
MKTLLVVLQGLDDAKLHKRFVKLLSRSDAEVREIAHDVWVLKNAKRPNLVAERLAAVLEDAGHKLIVCTIMPDHEHLGGWLKASDWEWIKA